MKENDVATTWTLLAATLATVALAAVVVLAGVRVYRSFVDEQRAARGWTSTPSDAITTRAAQADRLKHYAWIDREKGLVSVPIERAMTLVVEENKR